MAAASLMQGDSGRRGRGGTPPPLGRDHLKMTKRGAAVLQAAAQTRVHVALRKDESILYFESSVGC